ncbi:MAG: hypothetical protein R3F33_11380 [Planctomycetota bacterium]
MLRSLVPSALLAALAVPCALAQDHLVTPGMPGSEDHHLDWPDLQLDWGLGFDLRAPISLSGPGRDGSVDAEVRTVDLSLRSQFHRELWGHALLAAGEDGLELERAVLDYSGLGGTSKLQLGLLPVDFGKQMQARPYELLYPDRPLVLRTLLGDQVRASGLRYGDVFAPGTHSTVRASIGLYSDWVQSDLDGDSADGWKRSREVRDQPRLDELAIGARVTGVYDVGAEGLLQWGLSAQRFRDADVVAQDGSSELRLSGADQWLYGLDVHFGHADERVGPAWAFGGECVLGRGDFAGPVTGGTTLGLAEGDFFGYYLWAERQTRSGRALGALYSEVELPEQDGREALEASLYFRRPLIENSMMRFVLRHRDLPGEEPSQALLIQFVALAGDLGHGIDW